MHYARPSFYLRDGKISIYCLLGSTQITVLRVTARKRKRKKMEAQWLMMRSNLVSGGTAHPHDGVELVQC